MLCACMNWLIGPRVTQNLRWHTDFVENPLKHLYQSLLFLWHCLYHWQRLNVAFIKSSKRKECPCSPKESEDFCVDLEKPEKNINSATPLQRSGISYCETAQTVHSLKIQELLFGVGLCAYGRCHCSQKALPWWAAPLSWCVPMIYLNPWAFCFIFSFHCPLE